MIALVLLIAAAVVFGLVAAGVAREHALRLIAAGLCLVVAGAWLVPYLVTHA